MKILEKRNRIGLILILLVLACDYFAVAIVWADGSGRRHDEFKPGFSGNVRAMIGVKQSESVSEVSDDTKRIDSLDQDASSETGVVPVLLWKLGYTLENGITRFYVGTPTENIVEGNFMLEAGVRQKLSGGTVLTAAWIPNMPLLGNEVWSDPFLLGAERAETDLDAQAFKIEAESIFGSPVTLRYGFGTQDVESENSGQYHVSIGDITAGEAAALNRDSDFHLMEAMYAFRFGEGLTIRPQFGCLIGDAEGGANSFTGYQATIAVVYRLERWRFFGNINGAVYDYDETHPLFDRARDDDVYGCSLGASYMEPFGWKNISFDFLTRYENRDSNISFYDSSSTMAGIGLSWRF